MTVFHTISEAPDSSPSCYRIIDTSITFPDVPSACWWFHHNANLRLADYPDSTVKLQRHIELMFKGWTWQTVDWLNEEDAA